MSHIAAFDSGPPSPPSRLPLRAFVALGLVGVLLTPGCNALRYGAPTLGPGPEKGELTLTLEPVDLPARTDHHAARQPSPLYVPVLEDGWAQGFTVEVVDAHGDTISSRVLHHVKVLAPGRRELFKPVALRLVGAGSETRSADLPGRTGVPLVKGDSLLATAMVHNPLGTDLHGVRIQVRIRYVKEAPSTSVAEVYPFFLHVTRPDTTSDYDLPPGRSERSWEARPDVSGHILALGGHVHRFGAMLRLEDAAAGRVIWETRPVLDSGGHVLDVPRRTYVWGRGPRLEAGRLYRVTAVYDNPTGDTLRGAGMGTVGGIFRPDGPWPEVDPEAPLYVFDLNRELSEHAHGSAAEPAHGHHEHGGLGPQDTVPEGANPGAGVWDTVVPPTQPYQSPPSSGPDGPRRPRASSRSAEGSWISPPRTTTSGDRVARMSSRGFPPGSPGRRASPLPRCPGGRPPGGRGPRSPWRCGEPKRGGARPAPWRASRGGPRTPRRTAPSSGGRSPG
jgi:hypothetical protein